MYINESINSIDISKIDSNETLYKLMLNVYKLLNEIIRILAQENPENAFKLHLIIFSKYFSK